MPTIDIPYIVGVVREKEKALLEDDEYIRLINAATDPNASREALSDTAYGIHVASNMTSIEALDARLVEEWQWLVKMLGFSDLSLVFMAARYDALHIARALIDFQAGREHAAIQVAVGRLSPELLTSVIWNDTGWDDVPGAWRKFLQEQRALALEPTWTRADATQAVADRMVEVMKVTGKSRIMRAITELTGERTQIEKDMRPDSLPSDISAYEKEWDEKLLAILRKNRLEPHTIDAVVAWWYALVTEVKTVRLLLTAAGGGVDKQTLTNLQRSRFLLWI